MYQNIDPGLDTGHRMNNPSKRTMLQQISNLKDATVNVYPQGGQRHLTPTQHQNQHIGGNMYDQFAYRMNPNPLPNVASVGRITINSRQDEGLHLATALHHEVTAGTKQPFISQSKMKGIDRIGHKVDDAILYLNQVPSKQQRRNLANRITSTVDTTDYTPPGMSRITQGVSWAERPHHPNHQLSSSHGSAHAHIIEAAIRSTQKHYGGNASNAQFKSVYSYKLKRAGMNTKDPSRRKTRTAPIKKPWEGRLTYLARRFF